MRLHSLSVSAFGPFAGTEEVDFDALGADGLFLLHGATGAGKTTVLDAVAFALFGRLPGARQDPDGRRLVSDHAAPGAVPRVELELSVGGRRVRVARSPEHHRLKKRGVGTTKEQARATLTWLDGADGDGGAHEGMSRPDEVGRAVESLLGMSADQFFQVVLLPQGAFATFLRAETAERATLLATLFDTRRFADAERLLAEHRRSAGTEVDAGTRALEVLVGKLQTASGHTQHPTDQHPTDQGPTDQGPTDQGPTEQGPTPQDLTDPDEVRATVGWAEQLSAATTAAHRAAILELDGVRGVDTASRVALARAEQCLATVARRDRAHDQLAELERERDVHDGWTRELDAAGRSAGVAVADDSAAAAAATVESQARVCDRLAEVVATDVDGAAALADESSDTTTLTRAVEALRAEVGRLVELTTLATVTDADDTTAGHLEATVARLRTDVAAIEARHSRLPIETTAAVASVAAAERAEASVPALAEELQRAQDTAAAAAQVPERRVEHVAACSTRDGAAREHVEAKQHWLDLREQRLSGMAAELAAALEAGQPCAVCGATEHPRPAEFTAGRVSGETERAAHRAETDADARLGVATAAAGEARRRLDNALARGGPAPDVAEKHRLDAETAHARATVAAQELAPARALADALAAESDELGARERRQRHDLSTAQADLDGVRARVGAARERLERARGRDPDVPVRRARLHVLTEGLQGLLDARAELASARRTCAAQRERVRTAAADSGFGTEPDAVDRALAAVRTQEQVAALRERVGHAEHRRGIAEAVLAEPEAGALAGVERADAEAAVARARAHAAGCADALGDAQGSVATAGRCAADVEALSAELTGCVDGLAPLLTRAREVAGLADVVAGHGQNSRKVSLHSYVLAARLEEVAVAASIRLRRMSGGRYELRHSDAAGPNGRRGGLGLDVLDDHTGVLRSTKTLSGGESFLASLSLALGLADVVAAEAGGVVLDTLFIDEGFGTLDPAALEEVMAVLDELRAGGRVVGLVSHVDELRQRIPTRLHVSSTRTGSHLNASTG